MDAVGSAERITNLVFCIHGMGDAEGFAAQIQLLDANIKAVKQSNMPESQVNMQLVAINWHTFIHATMGEALTSCSLKTVKWIRYINNAKLSDILLYAHQSHRVRHFIRRRMIEEYNAFLEKNPDFNGQIGVIGHSLGGIITHDLVTNVQYRLPGDLSAEEDDSPLPFSFSHVFCAGSPFSAMNIFRNIPFVLPECPLYNIFHPYDPMAYRCEPRFNPDFERIEAVLLPHWNGGKKMHLRALETFGNISSSLSKFSPFTWEYFSTMFSGDREMLGARERVTRFLGSFMSSSGDGAEVDAEVDTELDNKVEDAVEKVERAVEQVDDAVEDVEVALQAAAEERGRKRLRMQLRSRAKRRRADGRKLAQTGESNSRNQSVVDMDEPDADVDVDADEMALASPAGEPTTTTASAEDVDLRSPASIPPLNAPNGQARLDFVLQEGGLESSAPHLFSGISHIRYWANKDMALFLLSALGETNK